MLNGTLQKQTLVVILAGVVATGAAMPADMNPRMDAPVGALEPAPQAAPEASAETADEVPEEAAAVAEDQVFRDWRLACAGGACGVYTRIDAADGTEVLRVALGGEPRVLSFTTPLGLHLPDGLLATIGESAERAIPWRTCAPEAGCVADTPVDAELLAALRRERTGMAGFTLVEGVPVRLGFSLMGFAAARAALDGVSPDP
jgi:invasion protein IalB